MPRRRWPRRGSGPALPATRSRPGERRGSPATGVPLATAAGAKRAGVHHACNARGAVAVATVRPPSPSRLSVRLSTPSAGVDGSRGRRGPPPGTGAPGPGRARRRQAVVVEARCDGADVAGAAPRGVRQRQWRCGCTVLERARRSRRGGQDGARSSLKAVSAVVDLDCGCPPRRRSCLPSVAVAFEHRLAHRAQREACVPLQPVQMPFEARDRRQHRGPRGPVQSRGEARQPARRPVGPRRCRMPCRGPSSTVSHPSIERASAMSASASRIRRWSC